MIPNGNNDSNRGTFVWETDSLDIAIEIDGNGTPCIASITPRGSQAPKSVSPFFNSSAIPVDSIRSNGRGNFGVKTARSLIGNYLSAALRYVSHEERITKTTWELDIIASDPHTGVKVNHHFVVYNGIPVVRSSATVTNESSEPMTIHNLSSFTMGGLTTGTREWWKDYTVMSAKTSWFREAQWKEQSLTDVGIDFIALHELGSGHEASLANFTVSNRSSWSTGSFLPMGVLRRKDDKDTWLWQIEHNGSWRWDIGDFKDSVYLVAGGPTYTEHDWRETLAPGQSFTSVPAACCHVNDSLDVAFGALTEYRRQIIRPHEDYSTMPIIFNDFMNCLMGDPTEDKIKALLAPAARIGAEYFVIDAGWYAEEQDWFESVGEWEPAKWRFPSGFKAMLDNIRQHSMVPGVWVEPEVIGIRSPVASQLPEECFFQQGGKRVVERGRYQLDWRSHLVRERLSKVIDTLITEYGVGYFKFDYNIEVISGSDIGSDSSTGSAHLSHQRAYLAWVAWLLDKYPNLVVENCSSGAQRMDYASLNVHTLQSTSDQQDPKLYASVSVAIPTAVIPEQSASWAYPQAEWSDEINALTVVNTLLGRVHLSGRVDKLNEHQVTLIAEGMTVYKSIRQEIKTARPIWPFGLPSWHDDWLALALVLENGDFLLSVWRRGGSTSRKVPLPLRTKGHGQVAYVRVLYPSTFETTHAMTEDGLVITFPDTVCARLLRVSCTPCN